MKTRYDTLFTELRFALRSSVGGALTVIACLFAACGSVQAQAIPGLSLPMPAPSSTPSVRQDGIFLTSPLFLDGAFLFRIAAPINPLPDQLPIQLRATYIESVLGEIVATTGTGSAKTTAYDPKTLKVRIKHEGNLAVLEVVDAKHGDPLPVVTVTSVDAKYHQLSLNALATQWQTTLQGALEQSLLLRQPAFQRRSLDNVGRVGAALVVVSFLVWAIAASLRRRIDALREQVESRGDALAGEGSPPAAGGTQVQQGRRRFLALALRTIAPTRRLALFSATFAMLWWALFLAWFVAVTWAFSLFPQTSPLAHQIFHGAVGVAVTWIVIGLLDRVIDVIVARLGSVWSLRRFPTSEERARQLLRIPTIERAVAGFKTFLLVFFGVLATLGIVGIPVGSVVTIGGLAAIGVTLAAQNVVRDFLNGFLVLLEDQYVVGDYVTINAQSGLVERFTLRMVQIRDPSGDLITVPHSSVTNVVNQSRNWSRVDYRVPVDPAADVAKALDLVRAAMEGLAKEKAWRQAVLEPVEWIGISNLSRDWVVIRASMRTVPLRQFELRRELNERVRAAFGEAGIALGAPVPDNIA
jgi:small-conductance mechanosensitive channel